VKKQAGTLGGAVLLALLFAATASAQTPSGRLAGVVLDFAGKPQMGATVWVAAQGPSGSETLRARTNQAGRFLLDRLPVGAYSIRVTLAGFLPALSNNVVVSANATTVLKLELNSVFSTVAHMRQAPKSGTEPDDWDWVLRSSADTRPVLRWGGGSDDAGAPDGPGRRNAPRARVELTSGGTQPGVVTSMTQSSFAYDQPIGMYGKLLLAGQFSYDAAGTAGLATTWAPFGSSADAPRTTVALQQYRIGEQGPMLRTLRSEQAGSVHVGGRVTIHYTAEYVWVSLRESSSALHPRADVAVRLSKNWTAIASAGSLPANGQPGPADLETAVSQLGVFPAVMFRNGNPTIGNAWHEELRLEHRMVKNGTLSVAGFRDQSSNTAVFATSVGGDIPLDALPISHAVDGGGISTYGARAAYRQKLADNLEAAVIYAWAGTLTADVPVDGAALQALLRNRSRNSVALSFGGRIHRTGTRFTASYKWVDGIEVSRQDPYGESLYDADPFLNLSFRQALPGFLGGKKLEAVADLLNVLNDGTVYRDTAGGRVGLTASPRVLRGGLSFQF
jgi:carboxypeptidase family protein